MKVKKKYLVLIIVLGLLVSILVSRIAMNRSLTVTEYNVASDMIPEELRGFRFAQVSDLHNTEIGDSNARLLEELKRASVDIIVITGDLVDSRRTDIEVALKFLEDAVKIAPCYYVTGNHEQRIDAEELFARARELGVHILRDEKTTVSVGDTTLNLIGIDDPSYACGTDTKSYGDHVKGIIEELCTDGYDIALSHRPELFSSYCDSGVELVLSGHAHGGQIRLPFIGGLFAPGQGFFPKYDSGVFAREQTTMIVSRGIGNSLAPLRIFNRPELLIIELGA